jgi:hypothetical protein
MNDDEKMNALGKINLVLHSLATWIRDNKKPIDSNNDNVVNPRINAVLDNVNAYVTKLGVKLGSSDELDFMDDLLDVKSCKAAKDASYGGQNQSKTSSR